MSILKLLKDFPTDEGEEKIFQYKDNYFRVSLLPGGYLLEIREKEYFKRGWVKLVQDPNKENLIKHIRYPKIK